MDAATPALGYASNVISIVTLVFFAMVMFIFWLGGLQEKGTAGAHGRAAPAIAGGAEGEPAAPAGRKKKGRA